MRDLDVLAVAKAISEKEAKAARAEVAPGTYLVDLLVRITGGLKVGEDYEQSITSKVKPLDLWLATLDLLAPQVTDALVERIVERALDDSDESLRRLKSLKERTEKALETVRDITRRTCSGKVTTTLKVAEVVAEVVPAEELGMVELPAPTPGK